MGGIGFGLCANRKEDCFAYAYGRCRVLSDGNFGDRECPFYKHKDRVYTPKDGEDDES